MRSALVNGHGLRWKMSSGSTPCAVASPGFRAFDVWPGFSLSQESSEIHRDSFSADLAMRLSQESFCSGAFHFSEVIRSSQYRPNSQAASKRARMFCAGTSA